MAAILARQALLANRDNRVEAPVIRDVVITNTFNQRK